MTKPCTLFDKVWDAHAVVEREDGQTLLWIDRHFVHEGSHHAFAKLAARGTSLLRPDLTFGVADHYVPTRNRSQPIADEGIRAMVDRLRRNTAASGVTLFGLDDPRQGIVHVAAPEQGLSLPGLTIVCGDSHTSTHGAYGALAFGIGASDVAHVLATQTLWQRRPRTLLVQVDGTLPPGISAKDLALTIVGRLGADGGPRPCHRVCGCGGARLVHGRASDPLQPVHRERRPLRHGGTGRNHDRRHRRPPFRAQRRDMGAGRRGLARPPR